MKQQVGSADFAACLVVAIVFLIVSGLSALVIVLIWNLVVVPAFHPTFLPHMTLLQGLAVWLVGGIVGGFLRRSGKQS